ncbi:MAG: arsenite methyltransferase [Candidatus Wallbacteria bacterium]|nr:arsenite methyltransferase [Candidatus Wallbacteria bacterium]
MSKKSVRDSADNLRDQVRERYAGIVKKSGCCCGSDCGTPDPEAISTALGYDKNELESIPEGANLGLGCGNPQAIADLKPGETVLDLGSGAGFDCFLAARAVGPEGHVIGVDMTSEMLAKARENLKKSKLSNVEFRLGEIEHLPVADNSVEAIISNCVVNLSPDKFAVYCEAHRVLRAGGRIAISDVVALKPLTKKLKSDLDTYGGCVGGAALVSEIKEMLEKAGFVKIRISVNEKSREFIKDWFPGSGAENYVASATIEAVK